MGWLQDEGGKISSGFKTATGHDPDQENKKADLNNQGLGIQAQMGQRGQETADKLHTADSVYEQQANKIGTDEIKGIHDSTDKYINQQAVMENRYKGDALGSLTLAQSMDPNNAIAKQTRGLYENEAQGENREALANAQTMQSLGNQNFGSQVSAAGPMTGSQMSALMGANQAQTGAAYSNAQRRVQNLRDQGLNQGFARSDMDYNKGQQAFGNYGQVAGNMYRANTAENENVSNIGRGMADTTHGVTTADAERQQAAKDAIATGQLGNLANQISGINAKEQGQAGVFNGVLSTGGAIAGGLMGGPAGAAVGAKAGGALGGAMTSGAGTGGQTFVNQNAQTGAGPYGPGVSQGMQGGGGGSEGYAALGGAIGQGAKSAYDAYNAPDDTNVTGATYNPEGNMVSSDAGAYTGATPGNVADYGSAGSFGLTNPYDDETKRGYAS